MKKTLLGFILYLIVFAFSINVNGEDVYDEQREIIVNGDDTSKVLAYNTLIFKYWKSNPKLCFQMLDTALELSKKHNYLNGVAISHKHYGLIYSFIAKYDLSNEHYRKSIHYYTILGRPRVVKNSRSRLAQNLMLSFQFEKSLQEYQILLESYLKENDSINLGVTSVEIANLYNQILNFDKAEEYYLAAYKYFENDKSDNRRVDVIYNLLQLYHDKKDGFSKDSILNLLIANRDTTKDGDRYQYLNYRIADYYFKAGDYTQASILYQDVISKIGSAKKQHHINNLRNLAKVYHKLNNNAEALFCLKKAVLLRKNYSSQIYLSPIYHDLGKLYFQMHQLDSAIKYFNAAIAINKEVTNLKQIDDYYFSLAKALNEKKDYNEAKRMSLLSLEYARQIQDYHLSMKLLLFVSDLFSSKRDYKKAYEYHKKYVEIKDSILSLQGSKKMAEIEANYKVTLKERENEKLKSENEAIQATLDAQKQRQIVLIVVVISLVLVLLGFYLRTRERNLFKRTIEDKNIEIDLQRKELAEMYDFTYFKKKAISLLEEKQLNGLSSNWKKKDFINLSEQISEETNINISFHTLMRIFGKDKRVGEDYTPQDATKDAIAIYLGFKSWKDFVKSVSEE